MRTRGSLTPGIILICLGIWFLAVELSPAVKAFAYGPSTWPIQIIGVGALFFLVALITWQLGLVIPGSIIAGIGGLLYYQNMTGDWGSWAYAWALIPGFVGVGLLLFGLLARRRGALIGAAWNLFASVVLFGIFGSFLGGGSLILRFWPLAVILLGLLLLGRGLFRRQV